MTGSEFIVLRWRDPPSPKASAASEFILPTGALAEVGAAHEGRLSAEFDALGERQRIGVVDGRGLPAHVGLPRIRTGFAAATRLLLAAECSADLGTRRPDVDIGNAAIGTGGGQEALGLLYVAGEDAGRQALWNGVVERQRVVEFRVAHHIENGCEGLARDSGGLRRHLGDGWRHIESVWK